ncbi:predicted protein [Nematostella vectensis]|uniref:Cytochrome P450 n=1 Tax=Nematostella vectensis TaxID=45351 RepID=A7SVN6_NEMVE|nr:predicted protein [Nematostella vectensis]|eukprot:XP_001624340.1 predicted protein [Nematostella vectensis]
MCALVLIQYLHKKYSRIPGPERESFIWGNAKEFQRLQKHGKRKEEILRELSEKYGPVFVTWEIHKPEVTITDLELVRNVMASNFSKDRQVEEKMAILFGERFLGDGFATSMDPNTTLRKRLVLDAGLNEKALASLMGGLEECCDKFSQSLSEITDGKTAIDMEDFVKRMALDIMGKVAFGIKINSIEDPNTPFYTALEESRSATHWALEHPLYQWDVTSFEYQNEVKEAVKFMRDYGKKVIDGRRVAMDDGEDVPCDVLDAMLKAADEHGDITLDDLLDDFVTAIFIGQEQVSSVLTSVLLETSRHKGIQEKLVEEFNSVLKQDRPTLQDLKSLKYCDLVIKETMRMHPPVPAVSYITSRVERIGRHCIPEGTKLQILPYIVHRDPEIWDQPDEFRPERFAECQDVAPPSYMPFVPAVQDCIGREFLDVSIKLLLTKLLPKFCFSQITIDDGGIKCLLSNYEESN